MKHLQFLLAGDEKALELLAQLLATTEHVVISKDERGNYWLAASAFYGLSEGQARAATENFLDVASGLMRLWAGVTGRVSTKGAYYSDTETGKSGGITFDLFTVAPRFRPDDLLVTVEGGLPLGAALLRRAEHQRELQTALSIIADGGEEWWQIYILLEILRDHYGARPNKRWGDWGRAFKQLRQVYGVSRDRLESLRRTADYHRHATKDPPPRPWTRVEAARFVHQAIRDWIAAATGITAPNSGTTDSPEGQEP